MNALAPFLTAPEAPDPGEQLQNLIEARDAEQTARELPILAAGDLSALGAALLRLLSGLRSTGTALESAQKAAHAAHQLGTALEGLEEQAVDDDGEGLRRFHGLARAGLPQVLRPYLDITHGEAGGFLWLFSMLAQLGEQLALAETIAAVHYRVHGDEDLGHAISGALGAARVAVTRAAELNAGEDR
ncbi:hypothetical protein [Nocardia sp. NPDC051832]|uniref:hypothetical protein n=1 Tax=Nocardia sp. NPDC051832 TaxID=3155673 RepID=UPI00343BBF07